MSWGVSLLFFHYKLYVITLFRVHLWVSTLGAAWILSRCCSLKDFSHLQAACQRIWDVTDLLGCLLCLRSSLWRSRWSQRALHRRRWSCRWGSWQRSACHHAVWAPNVGSILSLCCSLRGFCRLRATSQRRSVSVGQGGYPPCPESWPSRSRLSLCFQLREWLFFLSMSLQRFAFVLNLVTFFFLVNYNFDFFFICYD